MITAVVNDQRTRTVRGIDHYLTDLFGSLSLISHSTKTRAKKQAKKEIVIGRARIYLDDDQYDAY